jgi:glucose-6-phosphate isomerase
VLATAEVYYCLKGEGYMVLENPEGEAAVEVFTPGKVLYVPPRWAHRSVCTSRQEDLVFFFVYPAHAGHDYGTIEGQGFRKLVVEGEHGIEVIDNPRWKK